MVTVLFARKDSIYKTIPECDVYDADRDALTWQGGSSVIAHPPCRAWGQMRGLAKPREGERELAIWAVEQVRRWGGVLEHPKGSLLWPELNLPKPGRRDSFGGYSIWICQHWFGHKAEKQTLLYVVGVEPSALPPIPFVLGTAAHVIAQNSRARKNRRRPEVSKAEREHTPLLLAKWLVNVANLAKVTFARTTL